MPKVRVWKRRGKWHIEFRPEGKHGPRVRRAMPDKPTADRVARKVEVELIEGTYLDRKTVPRAVDDSIETITMTNTAHETASLALTCRASGSPTRFERPRGLVRKSVGLTALLTFGLALAGARAAAATPVDEQAAQADPDGREVGTEAREDKLDQGQGDDESPSVRVFWDQGLRVEALKRSFTLRVAGSMQNDSTAFIAADENTPILLENGVQWRRARVFAEGIFARHFEYRFHYDFASRNPPHLKDAYIGFDSPGLPLRFRVGRFRTPLGLEGHTSGQDTTFMERGLISAFVPSRNTGLLLVGDADRQAHKIRFALGAIRPEDDFGIGSTDKLGVSARASYAFHPREGTLLHVGGNFAHRPVDETIQLLERPESNFAPPFVNTGDIEADSVDTAIFEFAVVRGPLSVQTEGALTWINRDTQGRENPLFWGGYFFVSYVVTGEARPYQADRGNFGRLHPTNPFVGPDGSGRGAFEVALRVSYLDLEDKNVKGGRLLDFTAGLGWHATRNARVLANIIWANQLTVERATWIAQVRLQWAY